MLKVFIDIQNRLMAKVPALRYVDEDWGQLDYETPPVSFPCALIDCENMSVSQSGRHTMIDALTIVVRVADLRMSNTSGKAPEAQKEKAFALLDTIADVVRALHGWTGAPESYGRLQRTAQKRTTLKNGIRIYDITFQCAAYNQSAQKAGIQIKNYELKIKN
jgi:hypothetical protein